MWIRSLPLLLLLAAGPAAAQSGWQEQLTMEILIVHGCEVAFLSNVVEREVNGVPLVMAKAHCDDRRVYDARRDDPDKSFTFSRCDNDEATTC